jgi:hypothetical protein
MTPEEYAAKYLKMKAVLADGAIREVAIDRYLNHGKLNQTDPGEGGRNMTARAKEAWKFAWDLIASILKANGLKWLPQSFQFGSLVLTPLQIYRPFMGKGSPQEILNVLWLASKYPVNGNVLTRESLSTFCNAKLGLDCNGFASNYWGATGNPIPLPESASSYLFNANPRTKIGDIRNGDAIVEYLGSKTTSPEKALHVAVVGGAPRASGNQLTFDRVQSAGQNGNFGLEIETGKTWDLKKETDGQLYFLITSGETAGRRCYFAAGPAKKPPRV